MPQTFVTAALFTAVVMVFMLYYTFVGNMQQKKILTSGTEFLIVTAVTGIAYICLQMQDGYDPLKTKWLLHIHVFASLYGWNLCGLAVICRFDDFPIQPSLDTRDHGTLAYGISAGALGYFSRMVCGTCHSRLCIGHYTDLG